MALRRKRFTILAILFNCFVLTATAQLTQSSLYDLQCEHLVNPLGLDASTPRFSWKQQDDRRGAMQTAYRIWISTDSVSLANQQANAWNSGWVKTSVNLARYKGKPLGAFTKYFWKVQVLDHQGKPSKPSAIASFETGMMHMKNWKGSWISDGNDIDLKPAPYFRRVIDISKKIKSARAYIAAAGLYELYLNGHRIGDHRLDPIYTRFDRRNLYITYDVTAELSEGKNAIGVLLGNGWYNHQSTAVWDFHNAAWRARPAFCMDLRVTYEDGSTETFSSGKEWKTSLSPVIFNSIYTAEHYDARKEQPGWSTASFIDSSWKNVIYRPAPSSNIVAQSLHPIRNVETISPKSMHKFSDTVYLFDMGRNISGVTSIKVKGKEGTIIRLKHGERLKKDGHVDQSNIDVHYRPQDNSDPFQTDIFILSGKGEESFMPRFNYKGFQYVEVISSGPIQMNSDNIKAYFMHSDVPVAGKLHSKDELINQLIFATNSSYLSNLFGYPTDCPQREKNGWTGDAHIAIETGLYGFDGITVYEKWLADHRDEQQPNGVLPSIIPTAGWGYEWGNGPDWTSTIAIIPWNIYLFYGDDKLLRDCYENIKRYVDHITDISPSGLTSWGLGDWVPVKSVSPVELTSTAYYFNDVNILARTAEMFGKNDDAKKYSALAQKIKDAFNNKYFRKDEMSYASGSQTELSVPLYWGLVPAEYKAAVAANLVKRVEKDSFHLDVGLLGQKAILNALSENGYAETAYRVATQKTYPSWGWWMVNGATTLYENWKIDASADISMNHIMFGEIGAWLYKGLGGIKPDPKQPGFRNIIFQPYLSSGLPSFNISHKGPNGTIRSEWKNDDEGMTYSVTVPANSTATVILPEIKGKKALYENRPVIEATSLKAGHYEFRWK